MSNNETNINGITNAKILKFPLDLRHILTIHKCSNVNKINCKKPPLEIIETK